MVNANGLYCFLRISMETHDSCWYNAVELVPLIAPLIILPALLWTCSGRADCPSVLLLIRMSPYSKTGWMKDFNIISKVLRLRRNIRCASISTLRPARFIQSSIWLLHEIIGENNTEVFVCCYLLYNRRSECNWRWWILSLFWWDKQRFCFRWTKWNQLLFCPFIYGSLGSLLMLLAASTSSLKSTNRIVSSANRCILVPMFSVRSLMKTKNKRDQELSPVEHRHW